MNLSEVYGDFPQKAAPPQNIPVQQKVQQTPTPPPQIPHHPNHVQQRAQNALHEFEAFLIDNNILAIAAGLTIGFATSSFIKSAVGDIVLPAIYKSIGAYLIKNVSTQAFETMNDIFPKQFNVHDFLKETLTFVFIILLVYLMFNWLLKRKQRQTKEKKN
jgi:large-conductance mechanosensitive channel